MSSGAPLRDVPTWRDLDVVDLGCGDGAFTRAALAASAGSVLTLDRDEARLAPLRAEAEAEPRLHAEQSDLEQVRLRFASYDVVRVGVDLAGVADLLRLARATFAGLRPGGHLLAVTSADPVPALDALCSAGFVLRRVRPAGPPDGVVELAAWRPPPGSVPR